MSVTTPTSRVASNPAAGRGPDVVASQLALAGRQLASAARKRRAPGVFRWLIRATRRLGKTPAHERRLLVLAAPTVLVMRVALYALPTRWLLKKVLGKPVRTNVEQDASEPVLVGRAVRRAARLVPRATCLTQALATLWLMAQRGYRGTLRIGVKREADGKLLAHAWVEHGSRIVVGQKGVSEYTVMPTLEGALWPR
jgi:hypothetical protein